MKTVRIILIISIHLFSSCGLYVDPYKHNIALFEQYISIDSNEYKIKQYKFVDDEVLIKAMVSQVGRAKITAQHKFNNYALSKSFC